MTGEIDLLYLQLVGGGDFIKQESNVNFQLVLKGYYIKLDNPFPALYVNYLYFRLLFYNSIMNNAIGMKNITNIVKVRIIILPLFNFNFNFNWFYSFTLEKFNIGIDFAPLMRSMTFTNPARSWGIYGISILQKLVELDRWYDRNTTVWF